MPKPGPFGWLVVGDGVGQVVRFEGRPITGPAELPVICDADATAHREHSIERRAHVRFAPGKVLVKITEWSAGMRLVQI